MTNKKRRVKRLKATAKERKESAEALMVEARKIKATPEQEKNMIQMKLMKSSRVDALVKRAWKRFAYSRKLHTKNSWWRFCNWLKASGCEDVEKCKRMSKIFARG